MLNILYVFFVGWKIFNLVWEESFVEIDFNVKYKYYFVLYCDVLFYV